MNSDQVTKMLHQLNKLLPLEDKSVLVPIATRVSMTDDTHILILIGIHELGERKDPLTSNIKIDECMSTVYQITVYNEGFLYSPKSFINKNNIINITNSEKLERTYVKYTDTIASIIGFNNTKVKESLTYVLGEFPTQFKALSINAMLIPKTLEYIKDILIAEALTRNYRTLGNNNITKSSFFKSSEELRSSILKNKHYGAYIDATKLVIMTIEASKCIYEYEESLQERYEGLVVTDYAIYLNTIKDLNNPDNDNCYLDPLLNVYKVSYQEESSMTDEESKEYIKTKTSPMKYLVALNEKEKEITILDVLEIDGINMYETFPYVRRSEKYIKSIDKIKKIIKESLIIGRFGNKNISITHQNYKLPWFTTKQLYGHPTGFYYYVNIDHLEKEKTKQALIIKM